MFIFKNSKIQKFKIAPKSPAPSKSPPKGETFTVVQLRLFLVLSLSPFRGLGLLFKDSRLFFGAITCVCVHFAIRKVGICASVERNVKN